MTTLQTGARLGPYEIVASIGAGGMGEVFRARDPRLRREVAVKVLSAEFAADATRLHRFEQEARAIAALSHPNIFASSMSDRSRSRFWSRNCWKARRCAPSSIEGRCRLDA